MRTVIRMPGCAPAKPESKKILACRARFWSQPANPGPLRRAWAQGHGDNRGRQAGLKEGRDSSAYESLWALEEQRPEERQGSTSVRAPAITQGTPRKQQWSVSDNGYSFKHVWWAAKQHWADIIHTATQPQCVPVPHVVHSYAQLTSPGNISYKEWTHGQEFGIVWHTTHVALLANLADLHKGTFKSQELHPSWVEHER